MSSEQYVQAKSNRDILHAIRIIQVQSNRYIHESKKNYSYTWSMRDEKIYFVKYEG